MKFHFLTLVFPLTFFLACSPSNAPESALKTSSQPVAGKLNPVPPGPLVSIDSINNDFIHQRMKLMRAYYLNHLGPDGSMTYLYDPRTGAAPKNKNNMIRQWMTTLALFRLGNYFKDETLLQAAEKNLKYNVRAYTIIDEKNKFAYIYFRNKAKLGAAAFGLMSVMESKHHPQREKLLQYFLNFILHLHQKDGSFITFYLPKGRNDNHNFYPGEALLALMTLYETNPQKYKHIIKVAESSFQYYREYFHRRPNPAFVPWQTMALYKLYQKTKNKELVDFIFEMNDFLIEIQNTPKAVKTKNDYAMGRFFDPQKRKYGPPHASSTAIYSEGLADAWRLAKELKDTKRAEAYEYAIRWGLRSLFQLQYTAENTVGLYSPQAAIGGIRTTLKRPRIRVDNTQHATMALMNYLSAQTN